MSVNAFSSKSLKVDDLSIYRGGVPIVSNVSFEVSAGDILRLTGPNGVGKTTLLRALAGLNADWTGAILWNAEAVRSLPHVAGMQVITHQNALKASWTVLQNVQQWAPQASEAQLLEGLASFGVEHLAHVPARHLSAGQARRACLARLLITSADVWLLDEPGVSLDVDGKAVLARHITAFAAQGGVVIVATHGDVSLPDSLELKFERAS